MNQRFPRPFLTVPLTRSHVLIRRQGAHRVPAALGESPEATGQGSLAGSPLAGGGTTRRVFGVF